jgi:methyl-accepting chemotaxis protein
MKFTIRTKLLGLAGLLLALLTLVGVLAVVSLGRVNARAASMYADQTVPAQKLGEVSTAVVDAHRSLLRQLLYTGDAGVATQEQQARIADDATVVSDLAAIGKTKLAPAERAGLKRFSSLWAGYRALRNRSLAEAHAGHITAMRATVKQALTANKAARKALKQVIGDKIAGSQSLKNGISGTYSSSRTLVIAVVLVALLIGLALSYLIARGITAGVRQMLKAAEAIAVGDVEQEVVVTSRDELAQTAVAFQDMLVYLKDAAASANRIAAGDLTVEVEPKSERDALGTAFATMVTNLRSMIGDVSGAAATLSSASQQMAATSEEAGRAVGEIANAVSDVSAGAERQARMLEQARASTAETASAAEQAGAVAEEGVVAAEQAAAAMQSLRSSTADVTGAIRDLAGKSEQIGGIVEAITGIAGQTNLLALNAAIEAARAGEQGRGFAVVAEEVRKLAEESQHAAESISQLVSEIQIETDRTVRIVEDGTARTEESSQTVEATREAFRQIGASVTDMRTRIEQIVVATGEVAAVAEQSSASSEEVSASTEQTSASTQEIATSSQELARTSEQLSAMLTQFKVA